MKIEDYKGYKITEDDISYIKNLYDGKLTHFDPYENKVVMVFEKLVLNKYDQDSFIKLTLLCRQLLRNFDDSKAFELGLKISFNIIDLGEKNLKKSNDLLLEYRLCDLYLTLAYIIINCDFIRTPYSYKAEKFNIDRDNELALSYLQKAILYRPNDSESKIVLGMCYYLKRNYYKAFDYLIGAMDFYNLDEHRLFDKVNYAYQLAYLFTKIGIFFDNKKDEMSDNCYKAFVCFKAAYYVQKYCENSTQDLFIFTCYNMAYSYYKGVGVGENHETGKKYLDELASGLLLNYGKDITKIKDPDEIIKNYYKPNFFSLTLDVIKLLKIDNNLLWIDKKHKKITIDNNKIVLEAKKDCINGFAKGLNKTIKTSSELVLFIKKELKRK